MYYSFVRCIIAIGAVVFFIALFIWLKRGKRPQWVVPLATCFFVLLLLLADSISSYELTQYFNMRDAQNINVIPANGKSVLFSSSQLFIENDSVGVPQSDVRSENLYQQPGQIVGYIWFDIPNRPNIKMELLELTSTQTLVEWAAEVHSQNYGYLFYKNKSYYAFVNPNLCAKGRPYCMPTSFFETVYATTFLPPDAPSP